MIKEVDSIKEFEKGARIWNSPQNRPFWENHSCLQGQIYDPDYIENNIKLLFLHTINNPDTLPCIKIWNYKENNKILAGCAFQAEENMMTRRIVFEEIYWQMCGKFANSFKESKILLKLLKNAESYAKKSDMDSIAFSRHLNMHKLADTNDLRVSNFYTRNGFSAQTVLYSKSLK